jgi:hypothetical protein
MPTKRRKAVSSSSSSSSHDKPGSDEPDAAVGAGGEVVADAGHEIGDDDDAIIAEALHAVDAHTVLDEDIFADLNDDAIADSDTHMEEELFGATPGLFP